MATSRRPPTDEGLDTLRRVHEALRRRYHSLVQQVTDAAISDAELLRLGCFALQRSTSGFALVRNRRIRLTNDRWRELEGGAARGWTVSGAGRARRYRDLGTLAAAELRRVGDHGGVIRTVVRGADRRRLRMYLEPLGRDARGTSSMAVLEDATVDRARTEELARLRETVVQRERLSALGQLASGIVHDLGNTVGALKARLQLAAIGNQAEARRQLGHMSAAVDSMRATLDRLQRFSAQGDVEPAPVDLRAAIESAVAMIAPALGGKRRRAVEVELALPRTLPGVLGHAADLQSVFINLLINARDAMPDGGTVLVAARASRGRVVVTVRDDGPGVAPEHLPRLFEPFFTTRAAAGHSGLGLSLASGIIRAAEGTIRAANRPEGGLEITLALPAVRR